MRKISHAAANGQASRKNVAYLTDRILFNKGLPQVFWTQYDEKQEIIELPKGVKTEADIEMLNTTRALFGLGSIQEYIHTANQIRKLELTS